MKITTNNVPRQRLTGFDLTVAESEDFKDMRDWLDRGYFRYKGEVYLDEFMVIDSTMRLHCPEFADWDGYMSESFYSGLVVKYNDSFEDMIIGRYQT